MTYLLSLITGLVLGALFAYHLLHRTVRRWRTRCQQMVQERDNLRMSTLVIKERLTGCCGYRARVGTVFPVYFNRYNNVVQCHACGQVYVPGHFDPLIH